MDANVRIARQLVRIARTLVAGYATDENVLAIIKKYNVAITQYRTGKRIDTQSLENFLNELNSATNGEFRVFCYGTSNCPFATKNRFGRIDTFYGGSEFMQAFQSKKGEIRNDRMHWTDITADLRNGDVLITLDFRDGLMGSWT